MLEKKNIFPEEIELSEMVLNKVDQAFAMIKQEDIDMNETNRTTKKFFKKPAVAIAGICILAVSSISVAAAIHYHWGRGIKGYLMASDAQQQELIESGVAKVYRDEHDYSSMAVTDNGITIVPDTVVSDDRFVYLSFKISGFRVPDGEQPGFDVVEVSRNDVPKDQDSNLNLYGGIMYDGIIYDENGAETYEDGSPVEYTKDGRRIEHYTDRNGDMEYTIQAGTVDDKDSLLGKTIHVDFGDMGTLAKADFTLLEKGNWSFDIPLTDVNISKDIKVGKKVEGTGFVLEDINISPVSIEANYSYSVLEASEAKDDDLGIPQVMGVVMKDGTRIPYLTDGGRIEYDDSKSKARHVAGYDRVVDVDEIAALIVKGSKENDKLEIPISEKEG